MTEEAIRTYVAANFPGVDTAIPSEGSDAPEISWGDTFFIYDPDGDLPAAKRFPFATIVTKDYGTFDRASRLDRPSVFRLNVGISRETYRSLFGPVPKSPEEEEVVDTGHDFSALDTLMPHPVYGAQGWVCVLNTSADTFEEVQPLIREAYELAVRRAQRRGSAG